MKALNRILLLGKNGQLGWELRRALSPLGEVQAYDYPEIDFCDLKSLAQLVAESGARIVVNAAAYTAVDRAESEPEKAEAVNARAPGVLAEAARQAGAVFVHYSTDYIFDGRKGSAYTEADSPNPLNVYGQSKLRGEQAVCAAGGAHWIFRTSWVYSTRRDGFVSKVLQWSRLQPTLRIVADQVGSPTWARLLAEITAQVLARASEDLYDWAAERSGIYHLAGDGAASRYEWAQAILALDPQPEGRVTQAVEPAATSEFPTPADRPLFSALDCNRFAEVFGLRLPAWREALMFAMERM